ncbi:hypothetical protein QTP86_031027, partial [Hemibagrus guttatus]
VRRAVQVPSQITEQILELLRNKKEFTFMASIQQKVSTSGVLFSIHESEHRKEKGRKDGREEGKGGRNNGKERRKEGRVSKGKGSKRKEGKERKGKERKGKERKGMRREGREGGTKGREEGTMGRKEGGKGREGRKEGREEQWEGMKEGKKGREGTPLTIKEEDVNSLFKCLNTRKATGPDSVSPSLLKHCANQLSPVFTDIFNTSMETCHVPACFKTSAIVPVPKKTKITGLNDYRPVALTSVVMKSFERLMLSYLKDITDPLLDPLQFTYRANRSVDDAVNMALHFILQHLDSTGSYARILWITDFLTDRRRFVRLGTHVSDLQHISTGSPQGCVLSPLLFSLYTNGCTSSHQSVKLLRFADDTTVIGLISDGDKSAYRDEMDRTTITKELKREQNIRSLTKKAQQRMYFLRQLKKFLLPVKMLVNFYTAIIESILTSYIMVWFAAATARDKAKLQRVIHSAEKVVGCSLPSLQELYFELESSGLREEIRYKYSHKGKQRLETFPYRIADGQWHKIALSISASHLLLHVDCNRIYEREIDSSEMNLSTESGIWLGQRSHRHGLFKSISKLNYWDTLAESTRLTQGCLQGSMQDVKLVFSSNGYMVQCPSLNRSKWISRFTSMTSSHSSCPLVYHKPSHVHETDY